MSLSNTKNKSRNSSNIKTNNYLEKLTKSLSDNLDFHNMSSSYGSHNFHSFPAKFPPQLPHKFITELTKPNDIVLDPMVGSGTTILESLYNNRSAIGFDIDPLALMITEVKTTFYNKKQLLDSFNFIISRVTTILKDDKKIISNYYNSLEENTKEFINYWFIQDSIAELISLLIAVTELKNKKHQTFFKVIFSSIIITKSGGVSLALDLAHTRPHRAKKVYNFNSQIIFDLGDYKDNPRHHILSKKLKSPINEFKKKFFYNIEFIVDHKFENELQIKYGDSQKLSLPDNYVDLIVTSPPYASNAIDYMRAHKFSLLWLGYDVNELKEKRAQCIGGDSTSKFNYEKMPSYTLNIIEKISKKNDKKALVLHRYYSEMTRVLKEMYRVLKPNKSAIVVVGNSTLNGIVSDTQLCLKEIGENIGFIVPHIGVRKLDRNRRMLPSSKNNNNSQILKRMDEEFVIGFYKK